MSGPADPGPAGRELQKAARIAYGPMPAPFRLSVLDQGRSADGEARRALVVTVPVAGVICRPFFAALIDTVTLAAPSAFSTRVLTSPSVRAPERSTVCGVPTLESVTIPLDRGLELSVVLRGDPLQ